MARILGRRQAGLLVTALCCAVALTAGWPGAGSAATGRAGGAASPAGLAGSAGSAGSVGQPVAGPGINLLLNPGAQAGAASAQGWDAVTIPGWQVSSGLPTVVPYGAPRLARATGQWPAVHGGSLFAGGAGGTARLTQAVSLRQATGPPVAAGTRYRLSGWLGGTATSRAAVTVAFLSATGAVLAAVSSATAVATTGSPTGPPRARSRRAPPAPGSRWPWRRRSPTTTARTRPWSGTTGRWPTA